ncbi:Spastin [Dactylella cylindrospora]|nr:Spastin [Dactylella cylindrospora]
MQVVRRRALHSVLQVSTRSLRPISPRIPYSRYPSSNYICHRCQLHTSPRLRNTSSPDHSESTPVSKDQDDAQTPEKANADDSRVAAEGLPAELVSSLRSSTGGDGSDPEQPDKRPTTRSAPTRTKATRRNTKPKEDPLPKIDLPEWFLDRAVFLPEELQARKSRLDVSDRYGVEALLSKEGAGEDAGGDDPTGSSGGPSKEIDIEEPIKSSNVQGKEALAEETALSPGEEATPATDSKEEPEPISAPSGPEPEPDSDSDSKSSSVTVVELENKNDSDAKPEEQKPQIAFFTPSLSIDARYGLSPAVWAEVWATVKANLLLPKANFNQTRVAQNLDCVLLFPQTPETNGTYFLDAVSEDLARQLGATLIRIDAEDVAEIAGDYIETPTAAGGRTAPTSLGSMPHMVRSIGYDAQFVHMNNRIPREEEEQVEEEEAEVEPDDDAESSNPDYDEPARPYRPDPAFPGASPLLSFAAIKKAIASVMPMDFAGASTIIELSPRREGEDVPAIENPKLHAVLELMLDSAIKKRETMDTSARKPSTGEPEGNKPSLDTNRIIVQIRDFKELNANQEGKNFLKIIRKLVYQRRLEGREIMILGNSATIDQGTEINAAFLRQLQFSMTPSGRVERMIVVPPQPWDATRELLERDRKARIREINMRHLKGMITRRSGEEGQAVVLEVPKDWHFDNIPKVPTSSDFVWDLDHVHRLCLTIIGSIPAPAAAEIGPRIIGPSDVAQAVRLLKMSDKVKVAWSSAETKYAEDRDTAEEEEPTPEEAKAARIRKISRKCNKHEKKLLGGVIDASSIGTGFDQVRAAPDTIDALKTLTSLSLLRPEAFSYGVLAVDRIPGVLLYGPPGTGKTLLAKAVAKEGGATVLEVSGSEVYDMYVGEGEKNVKAIFSLAKKLSPCVVFIDEADAIFGARTAHHQRTSHRELINQFLKEWDGMANMSAFIMVATNRPFDLDDAVLRRLPRRILIDLPTAEDRQAILKIHLAGEDLDTDVDLEAIASDVRTNLYSGSDLKNVAVAAALAAVREEEDVFKVTGEYPAKRLLKAKHFEQALGEITASISDDMGSLGMIRKFDEKYGDRKGKKKKTNKWGFGSAVAPVDEVKEMGTGRVRN